MTTRSCGVWLISLPAWTTRGRIGLAYRLSEWLDCDCHVGSSERAEADAFEAELRALPPLRMDPLSPRHLAGVTSGAIGKLLTPGWADSLRGMRARPAHGAACAGIPHREDAVLWLAVRQQPTAASAVPGGQTHQRQVARERSTSVATGLITSGSTL